MTDATMKDPEGAEIKSKKGDKKGDKEPVKELSEKELIASMEVPALLKKCVALVEKAVSQGEVRLTGRVLRLTSAFRKRITTDAVAACVNDTLPAAAPSKAALLAALSASSLPAAGPATSEAMLELEVYCAVVVILLLVDGKQAAAAHAVAAAAVRRVVEAGRRSCDVLAAKLYYYYSWTAELTGALETIRAPLLDLLRTATLRHDSLGQEVLLNLLLRNYLHYNLYELAEKLRSKTELPESRSNPQYCRYLYYLGRIRAVQLDYSVAKDCLTQAARKAPHFALGFRVEVLKWVTLVRLLMGEIPERSSLQQKGMQQSMLPYLDITQAVRVGDLGLFKAAVEKYHAVFALDKTLNLISRLRRNVIRTGLRRINLSYSCISLADVGAKLGLASGDDAACLVAKAIRDGAVDATLDYDTKCMLSKEVVDVYSTTEPQAAFHSRVSFCLDTYNEAVRAMRYPPGAHKKGLESAEARRERLQQEQELAKHIAEEDEEDF